MNTNNLTIKIFNDVYSPELKEAWIKLQHENNIFPQMYYEWIEPWVRFRSGKRKLHIVIVIKKNQIVAIAPFCIEIKFGIHILTSIPIHYGDKFEFIVSNEFEKKDIYFCIFKEIGKSNKYSAIVISQIESGSELYNYLMSFNYKSRKLINCPTTDFSGLTFDEFLKKLKRNVRSDFRRGKRRIAEIGDLQFEIHKTKDYYLNNENVFRELYEKRWGKIDKNLPDDNYYNCRRESYTEILDKGNALIIVLKINNEIVGYRLGFLNDNVYHDWKLCFDIEYSKYEISSIMTSELIAYLIENGFKKINYGPGDYSYKRKWSPDKTAIENYIFLKALNNNLASVYLNYELKYKDKIKNVLTKIKRN